MFLNQLRAPAVVLALAGAVALAWGWQAHSQTPAADPAGGQPVAQAPSRARTPTRARTRPSPPRRREGAQAAHYLRDCYRGREVVGVQPRRQGPGRGGRRGALPRPGRSGRGTWTRGVPPPRGIRPPVYALAYSPDGKAIAWGVTTGRPRCGRGGRAGSRPTSRTGASRPWRSAPTARPSPRRTRTGRSGPGTWPRQGVGPAAVRLGVALPGVQPRRQVPGLVGRGGNDHGVGRGRGEGEGDRQGQARGLRGVSLDGKTLAAAGRWGEPIRLLDAATGEERAVFKGLKQEITGVLFSPTARRWSGQRRGDGQAVGRGDGRGAGHPQEPRRRADLRGVQPRRQDPGHGGRGQGNPAVGRAGPVTPPNPTAPPPGLRRLARGFTPIALRAQRTRVGARRAIVIKPRASLRARGHPRPGVPSPSSLPPGCPSPAVSANLLLECPARAPHPPARTDTPR